MAKILEPILGRRQPDGQYSVQPKGTGLRSSLLKDASDRHAIITVRLRPLSEARRISSRWKKLVRTKLAQIEETGELRYAPERLRRYSADSRQHHIAGEDVVVLRLQRGKDGKVLEDLPGEPVALPIADAIVLLRDEPAGLGFLVEEVDVSAAKSPKKDEKASTPPLPGK